MSDFSESTIREQAGEDHEFSRIKGDGELSDGELDAVLGGSWTGHAMTGATSIARRREPNPIPTQL